jgi:nucleoside-diphosphate kinase
VGEIIGRYERAGLKLVAMKMAQPSSEHIEKHYTLDPDWRRITGEKTLKAYKDKGEKAWTEDPLEVTEVLLGKLKRYMTMGPVVAIVLEGMHAVETVRKITGGTEPRMADMGTIRGDFVTDSYSMSDEGKRSIRNVVHASGSLEDAEKEIPHWFREEELLDYSLILEELFHE